MTAVTKTGRQHHRIPVHQRPHQFPVAGEDQQRDRREGDAEGGGEEMDEALLDILPRLRAWDSSCYADWSSS
jgi:hypothetical protein